MLRLTLAALLLAMPAHAADMAFFVKNLRRQSGAVELFSRPLDQAYEGVRHRVGRAILLGLEILIIADIVRTITIDPTLESVITLGVLVLVRTFLSFSLEIELEGVVPWRRSEKPGPSR